jgi:peptide chain release factor 1
MFEKLESLKRRYEELERLLVKQEVISDTLRYQQLAKEFSDISPIINKYREYKKINREIEETSKLLTKKIGDAEFEKLTREELFSLNRKKKQCEEELSSLLTKDFEEKEEGVIVEIRAGTGGTEAGLFVADLYRMYTKYAARMQWNVDIISSHPIEGGGFKEIIFSLQGKGVYKRIKYESGTHRVQRVPVTESSGRIHTSAVTVAVLPEVKEVEIKIAPKDLKVDVFRSSGPGGQSVNTADSAVRLTHLPSGIVVSCQDERSQLKNKLKALRVLRARLLDRMKRERQMKIASERKSQVGTGDRSAKIRTYNFPDHRVTDHRVGLTIHKLDRILEGELDEIINALIEANKA